MAITNYGELRNAVRTWLDRSDTTTINMIPDFIYLAEKQIMKSLFGALPEIPSLENEIEIICYPYTDFIDMPADMGRIKYIYLPKEKRPLKVTTYPELLDKTVEGEVDGVPKYYARHIRRIYFRPQPPTFETLQEDGTILYDSIPIRVVYVRDAVVFQDDLDSSYLLTTCPETLLFTALSYGYDFIKDYENKQLADQKALQSLVTLIAQLKAEDIPDTKAYAAPDEDGGYTMQNIYPYM